MPKTILFLLIVIIPLGSSATNEKTNGAIDSSIQTSLKKMVGIWEFDPDYIHIYLTEVSRIQKQWCGYGWDKNEIARREKEIKEVTNQEKPFLVYNISVMGTDSLNIQITNDEGERLIKILSQFKIGNNDLIYCVESNKPEEPFIFRFDEKYIYLAIIRLTPKKMNCDAINSSAEEVWLATIRLKRKE